MEHSLELAIQDRLRNYLNGDTSLDEFKTWLVGATWNSESGMEPTAARLASHIILVLAEHSGGYRTDAELLHELTNVYNSAAIEAALGNRPLIVSTTSATEAIKTRT